ncbi:putative septum site-determining protein MinC [Parvimonas sp. KA00067]|uniref:VirB4-like conjugal transfer ATPase, CD1110 family n=1 Tax=Parvimonas sp. KA00067 TaxID=1588755 RepID=UPI000791D97F|nr:DUF87 domain-containing protein [Parvimonas sp. KA00067]KXB66399.1 putative septum site-determining protein MinC [Parvimonas sp. KA00067]
MAKKNNKTTEKLKKLNNELKKVKIDRKKTKEKFNLKRDIKRILDSINVFLNKNAKTNNVTTEDTVLPLEVYKNGVFKISKNEYSKTLEFFDRNYTALSEEDRENLFINFSEILNSFDSSNSYQFSYINCGEKSFKLEDRFKIENKNDAFDEFRDEYNQILKNKINKNKGFEKRKFLTFKTTAKNLKEANINLTGMEKDLKKQFKELDTEIKILNLEERLSLFYEMLNPHKNLDFGQIDQKEKITPKLLDFSKDDEFKINEMVAQTFYLEITGSEISDEILKEFVEVNEDLYINFHIEPIDQLDGTNLVAKTLTNLQQMKIEEQKKAIKSGYDMDLIGGKLKENLDSVESLLEDVKSKNEKLFKVTILFTILAKDKLYSRKILASLRKIAKRNNSILKPLKYLQEQGLVSSLPLCKNEIESMRILTTSSVAAFIPFKTKELITKGNPFYYGNNQISKNIICLDRMYLNSANGLILGSTGSGKSFAAKEEMTLSYLLTDDEIIILDPEREYIELTKALDGEVIEISPNSKNYINPLDINLGYGGEDFALSIKLDFVLSFFELILKRSLEPREDSIIDRAVREIYKEYFKNPKKENIPILEDLYNELLSYKTDISYELCESLEFYVKGSMNIFNHHTNIDIKKRIICYDINSLGEKLRKIGMQIIQNEVWNRVTVNRNKKILTRYYVDEAHLFFEDPTTAKFNTQVYKRFRKYGGVPTLMTQNVKNILAYKGVEDIFENTDFILILKQAPKDREIMARLLNLSLEQEKYISNPDKGSGLIKFGKDIVPFENKFPKTTKLYKLLQTSFREIG